MKIQLAMAVSISASVLCGAAQPLRAQDADTAKFAAQVCASCHGPAGDSVSPAFPKLAAQRAEYLEAQLKAFRDHTRADPMAQAFMWGMTSQMGDDTIRKLAGFYSTQKPPRSKAGDTKLMAKGRGIFEGGIPAAKVQACATCHGAEGEGNAIFPRLAGQHAEYLVKQLVLFKSSLREGGNSPLMHAISTGLSNDQMEAVAAYLASR